MNRIGFFKHGFSGRRIFALLGICALASAAPAALAADKAANEKFLEKARASYYSLKKAGLAQFKCGVTVDWDKTLAEFRKTNPEEADRRVKIFNNIRFDFIEPIGGGQTTVTHSYNGEDHPELAPNFEKIFHGTEQTISGFFSTWSGFVAVPFLPDPSDNYKLVKDHSRYNVSTEDGGVKVLAVLGQDLAIQKVKVSSKSFDSTIATQFHKVDGLYLLSSYDATYASESQGIKGGVKVNIEYQVVDGFQIPKVLDIQGSNNGQTFLMGLNFIDCQVTRSDAPAPAASAVPAAQPLK